MNEEGQTLRGRSLIGSELAGDDGERFFGVDPMTGGSLEPSYVSASDEAVRAAVRIAAEAASDFRASPPTARARLLRAIAEGLEASTDELVARATRETALPEGRIRGETARTCGQLRLFADLVEEGTWVDARIDHADPDRAPAKPDIRSMLRGRGPVVVFGASNFPLAFSVAGGDTAAALAAGNPVLVKAHPAHPGTSELAGRVVRDAVRATGLPGGVFSLLFDAGYRVAEALVTAEAVSAVGFTGSVRGGRVLMDLAAARRRPIPVYAEMGSVNPLFVLPGAVAAGAESIARDLVGSVTLGVGQFCTNPGLVFVLAASADPFVEALRRAFSGAAVAGTMLTKSIAEAYRRGTDELGRASGVRRVASADHPETAPASVNGAIFELDGARFFQEPFFREEVFGPCSVVVRCAGIEAMREAARVLEGQLTASIHAEDGDTELLGDLARILEDRAGRLIVNGFPTGVEVCPSMVHGGPYPATSDGASSSVGTRAITRFCRAVAYQDWPDALLPPELQESNPYRIGRLVDGRYTPAPA